MSVFRLAHYSDIHFTLPPWQHWDEIRGKRWGGVGSYIFGQRMTRFGDVAARIAMLLDDVDAQKADHTVCTGDLTAISLRDEFAGCAALFGARLADPARLTVLPGNHDRYHPDAVDGAFFEGAFGAVSAPGGRWPFVRRIHPGIAVVGLDVSRPTGFSHSSGLCGPEQLARLAELLTDASLKDTFVVLALHYGLLRRDGARDKWGHRIRDDAELLALIDRADARVDLVVHGHMHTSFRVRTSKRLVHCAGSATDRLTACGYNVYSIGTAERTVAVQRRVWDDQARRFVDAARTGPELTSV